MFVQAFGQVFFDSGVPMVTLRKVRSEVLAVATGIRLFVNFTVAAIVILVVGFVFDSCPSIVIMSVLGTLYLLGGVLFKKRFEK